MNAMVIEIEKAFERLDVQDQLRLLQELPAHLKIKPEDTGWMKASEPAFAFWDNEADAIYDEL